LQENINNLQEMPIKQAI